MASRRGKRRSLSAAIEGGGDETKTAPPRCENPSQEPQVHTAEETGGGGAGEAVDAGRKPDRKILVEIDSQVLDCKICYEPLKPPIYQCEVGHALCFVCRGKLRNSCPICYRVIGYSRCFALEQMVDAAMVPCSNAMYGCDNRIAYHKKEKHKNACVYAPCFCPEDGCSFKGSTGSLLDHFVLEHRLSPTNFDYSKALKVSVKRYSRFSLFVGEDQTMFLLVNTFAHIGNALTMVCIRPHESGSCYSSMMSAIQHAESATGRYVFQMDPHVSSSSFMEGFRWEGSSCWCVLI